VSIQSPEDLERLRRVGRVVADVLREVRGHVRAGVTTAELDRVADEVLARHGARAAPRLVYGFPGAICISVGDDAVHGVPGPRRLTPGDLVKLDATAELDGYYADAAITVPVEHVTDAAARLAQTAESALEHAIHTAHAGLALRDLGATIQREVARGGCSVLPELYGHGIGRTIHEGPSVPQFADPWSPGRLAEGLVVTIEPIIAAGGWRTRQLPDGWTVVTADGSLSAHAEHTIVVTRDEPIVLTAA
jgi:methionyl aminopeptidase